LKGSEVRGRVNGHHQENDMENLSLFEIVKLGKSATQVPTPVQHLQIHADLSLYSFIDSISKCPDESSCESVVCVWLVIIYRPNCSVCFLCRLCVYERRFN